MSTTEGAGGYGGDWGDSRVSGGERDHNEGSGSIPGTFLNYALLTLPTDPARNEFGRIVDVLGNGRWKGLVLPDDDPLKALQSVYLDDTPIQATDGSWNFRSLYLAMVYGTNTQAHIKGFDGVEDERIVSAEVKRATPVTQQITDLDATSCRVKVSVPALINGENGSEVSFKVEVQDSTATWTTKVRPWTTTDRSDWAGVSVPPALQFYHITLAVDASAKTITRGTGSFLDNGFQVGHKIRIGGAVQTGNQQTLEITSVTDLVITCANATGLVNETISGGVQTVSDNGTIKGKFTSKYVKGFVINLEGTTGPWNIRVTKLTPDADGNITKQRALYFESLTTITAVKQRYPNTVVAELVVDSRKVQRVPKRGYLCDTAIIKVPTNYDPETRTYATTGPGTTGGIWDGTFKDAFSDNPAWCFFDMLTNSIYGAGKHIDASKIDTGALYQIAQYCDEMVSDGQGGTEPRFTCNAYITQPQEAIKLLSYMASIFRGAAYWAGGAVVATQDRPDSAAALFTASNVKDGKFSYSSTAKRARHTACIVWWNDPENGYARKSEYVEDSDGIARYGYNVTEITAFGCTSQGQARRLGLWTLAVELAETETVNFTTGMEGIPVRPGELAQVHDPKRFGLRHGGRVLSATASAVTVDSAFTFVADHTYTLACMLPDGTLESRSIINAPGSSSVFAVDPAFSAAPAGQWILTDAGVSFPITYRVVGVTEQGGEYEITALIHNASKYAAAEEGLTVRPVEYPAQFFAASPEVLTASEVLKIYGTRYGSQLLAKWEPCENAIGYSATAIINGDPHHMTVSAASAILDDAQLGLYEIRVAALYPAGKVSPVSSAVYEVVGQDGLAAPAAPEGLAAYVQAEQLFLAWRPVDDAYGTVQYEVRWGSSWDAGQVVGRTFALNMQLPAEGTYWVASLRINKYSEAAGLAVGSVAFTRNVVQSYDEDATGWTGTCTGAAEVSAGSLTLDTSTALTGTYEVPAGHIIDIGTAQLCTLTASYALTGVSSVAWDDMDPFDAVASVDGLVGSLVSALVEIAIDPDGSGFGAWFPYQPGQYAGRKFKLRVTLTTTDATVVPVLDDMVWTVDMPDRTERGTGVAISAAGQSITFAVPFQVTPTTHPTIVDMTNGDYFKLTSESATGFTIRCYNAAGTGVARTINWSSRGY